MGFDGDLLLYERELISLWLYKATRMKKYISSTYSPPPPRAPHTYGFVVITSITHPRKIILVVLQIGT
jgi:hypothetical protein